MTSNTAKLVLSIAHDIAAELKASSNSNAFKSNQNPQDVGTLATIGIELNPVYQALREISHTLADSYAQVKQDIGDEGRLSWAGTAHEIREILRTLLSMLAPDDVIMAQSWYRKENNTSGPTQKQRVRYILEKHGAGSKERETVEQVEKFEEMVGDLVRATYSRASVAAHQYRSRNEVVRILRYFDAFAHDLLAID